MSLSHFISASSTRPRQQSGFSLLEVLVALLVISISLLGVAGMQAISISNTGESGFRSIAATQASSMSAEMATNWEYWQPKGGPAPPAVTVNGSTVTLAGTAQTVVTCTYANSTNCTPQQMAIYDLSQWGQQLQQILPGGTGAITCTYISTLVSCQIQVTWVEKNLAQNQSSGAAANGGSTYHLQMLVQP